MFLVTSCFSSPKSRFSRHRGAFLFSRFTMKTWWYGVPLLLRGPCFTMSLSDTTGILGVNIMSICKKDTPSKSAQNLGGKIVKQPTNYAGFLHRTWVFCWVGRVCLGIHRENWLWRNWCGAISEKNEHANLLHHFFNKCRSRNTMLSGLLFKSPTPSSIALFWHVQILKVPTFVSNMQCCHMLIYDWSIVLWKPFSDSRIDIVTSIVFLKVSSWPRTILHSRGLLHALCWDALPEHG